MSDTDTGATTGPALLRVVRGDPSPEELAALVAAVLARTTRPAAPPPAHPRGWAAYRHTQRLPLSPGPGGWRESRRTLGGLQ
ncbi:acyl-CoA carboxylase epsilon subunit [Streptosporangium lutulentum]|uniref:Acyl-CoA carboxylase epsilon subunit n=1 Tax=Streptosporangium lutulentum TaxID=1461250 RepID=A0ABT9Q664_9ACTN|nr:acyl-CoA carboxylase epsilon subunit [Streptosporangium lutulentum]MDP9842236.1 hypothetical protein [Streptosporangium lutulentum]